MSKCPYTWPLKTKADIIDFLSKHQNYWPMSCWNGGLVLAWNIKVHRFDAMGHNVPGFPVQVRFDVQWREYLDNTPEMFDWCCEDALRYYVEGDWTNYPGIEQGEWGFSQNGRSGGWLILDKAPSWVPAPAGWKMSLMIWESLDDYIHWLKGLDWKTLRDFYRAIVVLDDDLRSDAREQEMTFWFAYRRQGWEAELMNEETKKAEAMMGSRADMYEDTYEEGMVA